MFKRILVICTGNICRSPMGEALFLQALSKAGMQAIEVRSAGLDALIGQKVDKVVLRLMQKQGIDISTHRGQQLNFDILRWADLVLVMEKAQKLFIESWEPSARGKVYRLGEWGDFDVPDPYRHPDNVFETALELISKGVSDWIPKLRE